MQTTISSWRNMENADLIDKPGQTVTCHFCFEQFEIDIEIGKEFTGHNTELYDCVICCNPLKLSYDVYDGEISDGNE